ncbi:MAG: glycoside hydrolase family 99-like domain-containing protein [Christensenellales bacterium]
MFKYAKIFFASAFVALSALGSYDVVGIVWPAYHPAPRWKELGIFEHGNGEWQNVYESVSKFKGHDQPKVPLWGYENEADPIVVARKIDAALAAGVNVFMYDWYWYESRPFVEDALNKGFLKAPNNERMKFFLMWANHDVSNLWNKKVGIDLKHKIIHWRAGVTLDEFKNVLVPRWIEYFKKPNYYKVDGKPVLAIYLLNRVFVLGVGGEENAKVALKYLDDQCKKAGFKGVFLMATESRWNKVENPREFGIDALFNYNWSELVRTDTGDMSYSEFFKQYAEKYDAVYKKFDVPFYPNVTVGWDDNSRYPANDRRPCVTGRTPAQFEKALVFAKNRVGSMKLAGAPKMIFINAWNEWTEDGYLEPDAEFGYGYLNAVARVFGGCGQAAE